MPHRSFTAAAGAGGVRSVTISSENDGVVRRHLPHPPLSQSPALIDALIAMTGAEVSQEYTAVPSWRLATSVPYMSLLDVLNMKETEAGKEKAETLCRRANCAFRGGLLPYEDEHLYSDRFLPHFPLEMSETGESGRPWVQSETAGVFILADLVGSALSGRMAVAPPPGVIQVLAFGFAAAGALAALFLPLFAMPLVAAGGVALGLGLSLAGLDYGLLLAPGVAPVACVSAMVAAGVGKVGILQRRQRSLVRLFGHYLAPDVIKRMAQSEQLPELGGDTRQVVVAFIDIVGFTKMSETLADRDVVRVVNSCFDAIGQVITRHQGYIDKYIGDAVMAVWNAPNTVENPEQAAVDSAREIVDLLDHMRSITGQKSLDLRVALNAGPVLVGDIGGEHRRSFTVMGTTVNTASRIEAVAKDKKVRLAVSQSVADRLPRSYPIKEIWTGQLRGLSTDLTVFTLDVPEMYMENTEAAPDGSSKSGSGKLLNFPR
ncbi:adenylate/guanylate cyclase domain-containing protein [Roseibium salinum]|nr:adenylate/guanylate cyclase domain-containing protein [Roseibium salinum]